MKAKRFFTANTNSDNSDYNIPSHISNNTNNSNKPQAAISSIFNNLPISIKKSSSITSSLSSSSVSSNNCSTTIKMDSSNISNNNNINNTNINNNSSASSIMNIEMTDMKQLRKSILHSYSVRFIGSTYLRKRQTYPMLNWILTDLLYQSKCIGLDLSVCITNCLMKENDMERNEQFLKLKQQLTQTKQEDLGLLVKMDIVLDSINRSSSLESPTTSTPPSSSNNTNTEYLFQICNPSDGQILLKHKFSRIFLFGKYPRQSGLFYYLYKSDDDIQNSIPTIYLFQAITSVQQIEICLKFNEFRPKLLSTTTTTSGTPNKKPSSNDNENINEKNKKTNNTNLTEDYIYNPLLDNNQINVNNNCFEVRHIGSVMTTNKKSTPAMIDRAAEKFQQQILKDTTTTTTTTTDNGDNNDTVETKSKEEEEETLKNNDNVDSNLDGIKPKVITTTNKKSCRQKQYRKNRFLVELIEENELDNNDGGGGGGSMEHDSAAATTSTAASATTTTTNSTSTKSLNSESGKDFLKKQQQNQQQAQQQQINQPNKTMLFIIGTMDICLISTENHRTIYTKIFANISHCSQGNKHANYFGIIVREPWVTSWFDNSSTATTTTTTTTSSQQSSPLIRAKSVQNGSSTNNNTTTTTTTTSNPTSVNSNESYVLHLFQCQSDTIVNDLLCSLRQSFNNAFRFKSNRQSSSSTSTSFGKDGSPATTATNVLSSNENLITNNDSKRWSPMSSSSNSSGNVSTNNTSGGTNWFQTYCQNCPMNWFHQLCLDIYGLDDVKIFAMLLYRIKHGSSEKKWKEYLTIFEKLQLDSLEQKVDLLIIMLKAKVDKMQRYHEIRDGRCQMDLLSLYEQIELNDPVLKQYQQNKSTLSLNRLEGLRLIAKSSLTNTFDAFRKRNRSSQSNENIQNPPLSPKSITGSGSGGGQSTKAVSSSTPSPSTSMADLNNSSSGNSAKAYHRRNTVADCSVEDSTSELDPSQPQHKKLIKSDSNSSVSDEQNQLSLQSASKPRKPQALMDIFIKTSTGNAMSSAQFSSMEELRQNLNQLLDPKLLLMDEDDTTAPKTPKTPKTTSKTGEASTTVVTNQDNNEVVPSINDNQLNQTEKLQNSGQTKPNSILQQSNSDQNLTATPTTPTTAVQMRHRLFRRIRKTLNPYKNDGIEKLINNKDTGIGKSASTSILTSLVSSSSESNSTSKTESTTTTTTTTKTSSSIKARQLWRFAIRKQILLIKQERKRKLQQQQQLQQQQEQTMAVQQQKQDFIKSEINKSTTSLKSQLQPDPEPSIMERIGDLYDDIPPIQTASQLEMIILQWTKLIEMFNAYCHNNPDDAQIQKQIAQQQSLQQQTQSTQQQPIQWWSHYERSIVDALRMGVPKEIRCMVWKFLARYRRYRRGSTTTTGSASGSTTKSLYRSLLKQLAIHQHAIFVDLGRTFPTIPYFAEPMGPGQLSLYNLLKAYSLFDKQVEYCQGLSFVAGILLLHMNEDDAFDQLCFVLYECGIREQYKPSMDALQMQMYQLNRLLYDLDRPLYNHLDCMDISPTLYAAPSFLTLFASQFPIAFVARVFDLLMFYGLESIFRIFFNLMIRIRNEILSIPSDDFESIMNLMRTRLLSLNSKEMEQLFNKCLLLDDNLNINTNNIDESKVENESNVNDDVNVNDNNEEKSTNNNKSFKNLLEQYRLEYKILQEEFIHLNQINKLAVEQKLIQKQQQKQKEEQEQKQQHQQSINDLNQMDLKNQQNLDSTITIKNSDINRLKLLIKDLRLENDLLKKQNLQLKQLNQQLLQQNDDLTCQLRRQSH